MIENKLKEIYVPAINSLNKDQIEVTSQEIIASVIEGWEDPLDLDLRLKFIEEVIKLSRQKIESNVKNCITSDIKERHGIKIALRNGYAQYDFEKDEEYKILKGKLKSREDLLKEAVKSSSQVFITESGEQVNKVPVKSYTKDSLVYTFEK
jgi:hypothetical protein